MGKRHELYLNQNQIQSEILNEIKHLSRKVFSVLVWSVSGIIKREPIFYLRKKLVGSDSSKTVRQF